MTDFPGIRILEEEIMRSKQAKNAGTGTTAEKERWHLKKDETRKLYITGGLRG